MPIFEHPLRPARPEPRDPARVEFERRILLAPPGPLKGPISTVEEIRRELKEREAGSAQAMAHGVRRVETSFQPPFPSTGDAEVGRDSPTLHDASPELGHGGPESTSVDFEKKELTCKSGVDFPAISATSAAEGAQQPRTRTLVGEGTVKDEPSPRRTRRRSEDIPWHEKDFVDGYRVSRYICKTKRQEAITAMFVAKALKRPLNMAVDLNPGLDDLTPLERMRFLGKIPNNINSYIQGRLDALKRPASWWPHHGIMARESNDQTHREEHIHGMIHVPSRDEMNRLIDRLEKQRENPLLRNWCGNPLGRAVDDVEEWKGGKFHSAIGYLLKAADSQSTFKDPTILYERSGAVLGKRVFITRNLTNPRVIAATAEDVARYIRVRDRVRKEKRLAALRRDAPPPAYPWE